MQLIGLGLAYEAFYFNSNFFIPFTGSNDSLCTKVNSIFNASYSNFKRIMGYFPLLIFKCIDNNLVKNILCRHFIKIRFTY